jgi:hypothetical protein
MYMNMERRRNDSFRMSMLKCIQKHKQIYNEKRTKCLPHPYVTLVTWHHALQSRIIGTLLGPKI